MRHRAIMHAGTTHLLVTIRDVSASGLLVETDLVLDVGVEGVLENHLVHGETQVRVVRHSFTSRGRHAMGLEVISNVPPAGDGSGLFRVG